MAQPDLALPYPKPPFRLGTTSYIYPDDILPNVERLAGWMDDIELLLFEATAECPLPGAEVVGALQRWADICGTSYTVHLPLDLSLASGDEDTRRRAVGLARQVIETMRLLDPWGYVVHVEYGEAWPGSWPVWRRQAEKSLRELIEVVAHPVRLCVENTEAIPPEEAFGLAGDLGTSICLDAGHLWKAGLEPAPYLDEALCRTRIVHLHGWDGTRDHRSLQHVPAARLQPLVDRLCDPAFRGVVTLEIFNEKDLLSSWKRLATLVQAN